MKEVLAHVDDNRERYVERLVRLAAQPSISTQDIGMQATAEMVADLLKAIGASTEIIATPRHPVVFGEIDADADRTLTFYNHYDVQPPDPLELWDSPPFEPTVRNGRLHARGVADNKGNLVARICAVDSILATVGKLPVNVKFVFEGEEEIGSPSLTGFADLHRDRLSTDGYIWESSYKDTRGRATLFAGHKAMLYVELKAIGANTDLHSHNAPLVVNPVWRMIWFLSRLKDDQERVLIPHFYDDIPELSEAEWRILEEWDYDEEGQKRDWGVSGFLRDAKGVEVPRQYSYDPTCNVSGIHAGYGGPGMKMVVPNEVTTKIDFRLHPAQDPHKVFEQFIAHRDQLGFHDIEIRMLAAQWGGWTRPSHPMVGVIRAAAEELWEQKSVVIPVIGGTSPEYVLAGRYGLPAIGIGVGDPLSRQHAPNESIDLDDYILGIKHAALVLLRIEGALAHAQ